MNYVSVSQGEEGDVSLDDVRAVFDEIEVGPLLVLNFLFVLLEEPNRDCKYCRLICVPYCTMICYYLTVKHILTGGYQFVGPICDGKI